MLGWASRSAGARVVGVSPDEVPAVERFAGKHSLDFTLLADADHAVADAYGTWVLKGRCSRRSRRRRTTRSCSARSPSSEHT